MHVDARAALLADQAETAARIASLRAQFDDIVAAADGVATDDEHDPEGATIAFERSQVRALLDQAHRHAGDVVAALARLEAGDYGRCVRCGAEIDEERLAARPVADRCARCV